MAPRPVPGLPGVADIGGPPDVRAWPARYWTVRVRITPAHQPVTVVPLSGDDRCRTVVHGDWTRHLGVRWEPPFRFSRAPRGSARGRPGPPDDERADGQQVDGGRAEALQRV